MRILQAVVALVLTVVVAGLVWSVIQAPGLTLYVGGPIITMDSKGTVAEALATDRDRIVLVGNEPELRAWAAETGARIVDLEGRALLPGFIDAHGHFPGAGITAVFVDLNSPPIGDVSDIPDLVARLKLRADETKSGEWVIGIGYDDSLLAEKRHPTRVDLDEVTTTHPVAVLHISGHLAATNSLGLEKLGIGVDTPNPEGGVIQRDADGQPNGVLEENSMMPLSAMLVPSAVDGFTILKSGVAQYVSQGVTTAQSGVTTVGLMQMLDWASWLGVIPIRLVLWPEITAGEAMLAGDFSESTWDQTRVHTGAVKLIADGSIQGYTGYLSQPYFVPPGDDPDYRGYPRIPRDELIEQVARFHEAGLQIAVHGNGDASIDDILDAYELAQEKNPREDARHIIIHAQMARDDQLRRMAELDVIPSFFSLHTFYWGDRHRRIFMGPERAARMSPAASAIRHGLRFTIHCDTPVVPMEPLRLVWSAVNRKTRSGFVVGEAERISPEQALRAVTIDAAFQHFEDEDKGSLEPGKLADLVIVSRNPLEDPETIDQIAVLETIVGGRTVYRAAD
jgi:predicted amidohydrolase YtcJ